MFVHIFSTTNSRASDCVYFRWCECKFSPKKKTRKKEQNEESLSKYRYSSKINMHTVFGNISNGEATENIYVNDRTLRVCYLIDVLKHIQRCMSLINRRTHTFCKHKQFLWYNSIMPSISQCSREIKFSHLNESIFWRIGALNDWQTKQLTLLRICWNVSKFD